MTRLLIVNADDFGQSEGINRGIIQCYELGIVTAASLMVRWPAAVGAARYARANRGLDLGLHLDLGEWRLEDGTWRPVYHVVALDDEPVIRREVLAQLERFRELMGSDPTHIDSHQHVHTRTPIDTVIEELASQMGILLRHGTTISYCGDFYGQRADGVSSPDALTFAALTDLLAELPDGVTELCCHPGILSSPENEMPVGTMYLHERVLETRTLCDPRLRETLRQFDISLTTFSAVTETSLPV